MMNNTRVLESNVIGIYSLTEILSTSLGPFGSNKVFTNEENNDVIFTNDGATILNSLNISNPTAKIVIELATGQDILEGDGTTRVVLLAGNVLKKSLSLLQQHYLHPIHIIKGLRLAEELSIDYIKEISFSIDELTNNNQYNNHSNQDVDNSEENDNYNFLYNVAKTCLSSKILGGDSELHHISKIVVESILYVSNEDNKEDKEDHDNNSSSSRLTSINVPVRNIGHQSNKDSIKKYNKLLDSISIKKLPGSILESCKINGLLVNRNKFGLFFEESNTKQKVLLCKCPLGFQRNNYTNINIHIESNEEEKKFIQREKEQIILICKKIKESGVTIVVNQDHIYPIADQFFSDNNIISIQLVDFKTIQLFSKLTNGIILSDVNNIKPKYLGLIETLELLSFGDKEMVNIRNNNGRGCTILIKSHNEINADEIERGIHDSLCVLITSLQKPKIICGGGSIEIALSSYLKHRASLMNNKLQFAIIALAESLEYIMLTLVNNAGYNGTELLVQLKYKHVKQLKEIQNDDCFTWFGVNMNNNGKICDVLNECKIIEPSNVYISIIKFAIEVVEMILRVDHITIQKQYEQIKL